MIKRILIDSSHAEEKRVAIINESKKLEEFEFETATKKNYKGNIYLAKITRVEPSLQAAFVDFGGNRHGFLAFNEIHPDYYQIPVADKEKLEEELAKAQILRNSELEDIIFNEKEESQTSPIDEKSSQTPVEIESEGIVNIVSEEEAVEIQTFGGTLGGEEQEDVRQEVVKESARIDITKRYKIQEVIKRNQILLVQVVKEERGNKGAALTTYLSLAGRYSVLMPNTANAGGISRKISNMKDRKRLREILNEVETEAKQSLIIRTAGQERTKPEIKRDFEYLSKTWDNIRQKTMSSIAPALVHEEGDLIRRVIRDLYTKDVNEILIEGEEGYKTAKNFMKILMPSHAKKIQYYKDEAISLFRKFEVEKQIEQLQSSTASLPSGGSLVINVTEALVAIDINSGKSTKERHIDETAFNTNMEAAVEIARQLRLRDLGGLIVIDFIDMDNHHHIHSVEKRLREALKEDRARIQTGRISQFGLLELSRQRLRPSILESLTQACKTCGGTGFVRSTESTALAILRAIEEEGLMGKSVDLDLYVPTEVSLYFFNHKRHDIEEMEKRFKINIKLHHDETLTDDSFKLRTSRFKKNVSFQKNQTSPQNPQKQNENSLKPDPSQNETSIGPLQEGNRNRKKNKRNRNNKFKPRNENRIHEGIKEDSPVVESSPPQSNEKSSFRRSRNRRRRSVKKEGGSSPSPALTPEKTDPSPKKPLAANDLVKEVVKETEQASSQKAKKGWWKKLLK